MKIRETIDFEEPDFSNILIVVGLAVIMKILFSSLQLYSSETTKAIVCQLTESI